MQNNRPRCIGSTVYFLSSLKSTDPLAQETKGKIDFLDGGHLGFLIRKTLAYFDLQVIPILPTNFRVS